MLNVTHTCLEFLKNPAVLALVFDLQHSPTQHLYIESTTSSHYPIIFRTQNSHRKEPFEEIMRPSILFSALLAVAVRAVAEGKFDDFPNDFLCMPI